MNIVDRISLPPVVALVLAASIAGCGAMPDLRRGLGPAAAPAPRTAATAPSAAAPVAGAAEAACTAQAESQLLAVRGVVGSREVAGEGGIVVSRDVMLRVERRGQVYDVRCRYLYASGEARIMSL